MIEPVEAVSGLTVITPVGTVSVLGRALWIAETTRHRPGRDVGELIPAFASSRAVVVRRRHLEHRHLLDVRRHREGAR